MKFKAGLIEFGERDYGRWIFQIYHPTILQTSAWGFQLLWDLICIRIDPNNNGYALILLGFGVGAQKAIDKPDE
jgi:hypothetical protein